MARITISDLVKRYGKTQIVHGISIDITDGEFVVLVGPSGCGKSTLVRMLAGLEEVSGGSIKIDDREVNDVEPKDRDIAMVFQSYALYPNMTVAENMGFSLRLRRADPKVMAERVAEAARILDLDSYLDRYPRELSGGQRQRVAMGRAMVRDPKVFLFDEPLSNLDAKLRVAMRAEIKALHQRLKTTTVYVTHDQVEAMTMADRIVVMREGRVEQIGTPLELYDHPDNLFVAQFIGSPAMNIVRGTLRRTLDAACVESADGIRWPVPACIEGLDGQVVQYGIRPEHISIVPGPEAGSECFAGTVIVTEPMGAETELQLAVGEGKIKVKAQGRVLAGPGEAVRFGVMPDMAHLFDADTGARLSIQAHVLH